MCHFSAFYFECFGGFLHPSDLWWTCRMWKATQGKRNRMSLPAQHERKIQSQVTENKSRRKKKKSPGALAKEQGLHDWESLSHHPSLETTPMLSSSCKARACKSRHEEEQARKLRLQQRFWRTTKQLREARCPQRGQNAVSTPLLIAFSV